MHDIALVRTVALTKFCTSITISARACDQLEMAHILTKVEKQRSCKKGKNKNQQEEGRQTNAMADLPLLDETAAAHDC